MSSNLHDTEPGGESTQYESIVTQDTQPNARQGGQLGQPETTSTSSTTSKPTDAESNATIEKIRYGQNISESGMGGKTTDESTGRHVYDQAHSRDEYQKRGDGRRQEDEGEAGGRDERAGRSAAGYGGEEDMDRSVGG